MSEKLSILSINSFYFCFRLLAAVFKILSSEVLGYDISIVTNHVNESNNSDDEDGSSKAMTETERTFYTLSTCGSAL